MSNAVTEDSVSYPTPSQRLFSRVLDGYLKAKAMPVIVAKSYDTDDRPVKWSPRCSEFICDVERAAKAALGDDHRLVRAFHRLLIERAVEAGMLDALPTAEAVPPGTRTAVIRKCAKVFRDRGLSPHDYFSWTRKRRAAA